MIAALVAQALACGSSDRPDCLPALFEDGSRLHDRYGPNLFDLDLMFRQHEICRAADLSESTRRIALIGNSAVFGLNVPAEESIAGLINERWTSEHTPMHIYNLGFITSYLFKDALITRKAIDYTPDLIVYGISLSDFVQMAPIPWPAALPYFFEANETGIDRLKDEGAAGLEELVGIYRSRDERASRPKQRLLQLREAGSFLRLAVRHKAPALINRWLLRPEDGPIAEVEGPTDSFPQRGPNYRCEKVLEEHASKFGDTWSTWNIFAYLEQLERDHGVEIAVFDLPIQHDPKGDCYNARYPTRADRDYRMWIREESNRRGIALWDFHDLLPKPQFEDTLHPTAEGNRAIAATLAETIKAHASARGRHERSPE